MGIFASLERTGSGPYFGGSFTSDFMTTTNALLQAERLLHSAFPGGKIEVKGDGQFTIDGSRGVYDDRPFAWASLLNNAEQLAEHIRALELDVVRRASASGTADFVLAFLLHRMVIEADLELVRQHSGVAFATIGTNPVYGGQLMLVVVDDGVPVHEIRIHLNLPSVI